MLIVLAILDRLFKGNKMVYLLTILFTGIVSVIDALSQAGFNIEILVRYFSKLPLYSQGLGWILPALIGIVIGTFVNLFKKTQLDSENISAEEA